MARCAETTLQGTARYLSAVMGQAGFPSALCGAFKGVTGRRGVADLSQAAFLTGAQRTITTLWPVLGAKTPDWLVNMYRAHLEGASWTEVVRAEKARMMDEEQPVSAWV